MKSSRILWQKILVLIKTLLILVPMEVVWHFQTNAPLVFSIALSCSVACAVLTTAPLSLLSNKQISYLLSSPWSVP